MIPALILFAVLALLFVIFPVSGIGPVIKTGDKSRNTLLLIYMRPDAWYEERGIKKRAVLLQEVAEFWLRWVVMLTVGALSFLIDGGEYQWVVLLLAVLFGSLLSMVFYGQLDLIGRAVEVLEDGRPGYLEAEAERLRTGTRGTFRSVPSHTLAEMIRRRFGIARVLIKLLG